MLDIADLYSRMTMTETKCHRLCELSQAQELGAVEDILRQQVEKERLLNQLTTQIRQNLEPQVILKTAVQQVQRFLAVDRLLIYQLDDSVYKGYQNGEASNLLSGNGQVTYEAISKAILSVLFFSEGKQCFVNVPSLEEKYRKGFVQAVEDIEISYADEPCFLEMLRRIQVRAKLVAPIVVGEQLWGLLIAHQCTHTRRWQESEKYFFRDVAEHLAIAINQSQLYAQLQHQNTILETRVSQRTQKLQDALNAAQAANRATREFLAMMSHELRSPLTCVIGLSETLLRGAFGHTIALPIQKQRSYLQTIKDSGKHLLELINDVLDSAQIEAGKAVLNVGEFSLTQLAQLCIQTFSEKARRQGVNLAFELPSEQRTPYEQTADSFCADERRVKQILFNLLDNAIKFTPSGGQVTLRVWREWEEAVFQVEDTGIGIPKHQLPLLFQKFQQLQTSYHQKYKGTGLGLALTKQLVEVHGGKIEVESVESKGSVFTVWIPLQFINEQNHTCTQKQPVRNLEKQTA